jgi:hypothetical protein
MGGQAMNSQAVKVGDTVRFDMGNNPAEGKVLEDRGPIGIGGRRLYLIVFEMGKGNSYYIELPAADLEVIDPNKTPG